MGERLLEVLLAGDSISFGYGPLVKKIVGDIFQVENLPENGGTSAKMLAHIDEWMIKPGYDVIQLNCGLHDVAVDRGTKKHRVPLRQYEENVENLVRKLSETSSLVVWATTTPVIDEWHRARKGFDRCDSDVHSYNDAALRVMTKFNVPVNDLHRTIDEAGKETCLSEDGVHMNELAYHLLAKTVTDFLLDLVQK